MKESIYASSQAPYHSPHRKRQGSFTPLLLLSPQSQRAALRGPRLVKIGSHIVVPKESFIRWVEQNTGGAA